MPVKCQGRYLRQLCYGTDPEDEDRAQYAVCYNTNTLIPEFTGHVLNPFEPQAGGRDEWAIDRTVGKLFSILLVYFFLCVFVLANVFDNLILTVKRNQGSKQVLR